MAPKTKLVRREVEYEVPAKNVAIIGLGSDDNSIGWSLARSLKETGDVDKLFLVNRDVKKASNLEFKLQTVSAENHVDIEVAQNFSEVSDRANLTIICADANNYRDDISKITSEFGTDITKIPRDKLPDRSKYATKNIDMFSELIPSFDGYNGHTVIVTNPADVLAQMFATYTGIPVENISGFNLTDTQRLFSSLMDYVKRDFRFDSKKRHDIDDVAVIGPHNPNKVAILSEVYLNKIKFLNLFGSIVDKEKILKDFNLRDAQSMISTNSTTTETTPNLKQYANGLLNIIGVNSFASAYLEYEGFKGFTGGKVTLENLRVFQNTDFLKNINEQEKIDFNRALELYQKELQGYVDNGILDKIIFTGFNTKTMHERGESLKPIEPESRERIIVTPREKIINLEDKLVEDLNSKIITASKNNDRTVNIYSLKDSLNPSIDSVVFNFLNSGRNCYSENERTSIKKLVVSDNNLYALTARPHSNNSTDFRLNSIDLESGKSNLGKILDLSGGEIIDLVSGSDTPYLIVSNGGIRTLINYDVSNNVLTPLSDISPDSSSLILGENGLFMFTKNCIHQVSGADFSSEVIYNSDSEIGSNVHYDSNSKLLFFNERGNNLMVAYDTESGIKRSFDSKLGSFNFSSGKDINVISQNGDLVFTSYSDKDSLISGIGKSVSLTQGPSGRIKDVNFIDEKRFIFSSGNAMYIGIVNDAEHLIQKIPYVNNFNGVKGVIVK